MIYTRLVFLIMMSVLFTLYNYLVYKSLKLPQVMRKYEWAMDHNTNE